ncbi:hypothetical protein JCM13304A_09690 [Desulfothermus okinawensis JCM 13304]
MFKKGLITILLMIFITPFFLGQLEASVQGNSTKDEEQIPDWIYPKPFKYDSKNLPDPFVPFIKAKKTGQSLKNKGVKNLGPLQKIDPTQLRLIGILYSKDKKIPPMALVELPDKKGYILKVGTYVGQNGAYVESILKNQVIIFEPITDIYGTKNKKIVLKLHKKEGE